MDQAGRIALRSFPVVLAQAPRRYIFDGDSLTAGSGASDAAHRWPNVFLNSYHAGVPLINYAAGGLQIADLLTDVATQVIPTFAYPRNAWVMCWIGANNQGGVAVDTYNDIVSYHQAVRAAGYKSAVFTILPRGDAGGVTQEHETNRLTINASIRANWQTFANQLVDVAADGRLQNPLDATYFDADAVHLNDAGYAIVAAMANGTAAQAQANLIVNPGMEIGGGDLFTGWTLSPGAGGSILQETTLFNGGARAVKLLRGSASCFIHQYVNVLANRKYRLSSFSRGDGANNGSFRGVENGGAYRNISGSASALANSSYGLVTKDFFVPADCAGMALDLQFLSPGGASQYLYFDDVSLTILN